ncbi:glycosyltransferase family 1 protein [Aquabacterium sp. CECT 9606]|uniref:glycosyltransferase family 4 protein n=1 Tax=Aquabacterium sp. CECT 9606 TaxID=2845822 RepID=UPI001E4D7FED|nr:glycosyltransferase family 1 protein [Aquabacterium sp. CECT 9606]CAH0351833.1 D-inositol-3-phosphate glycosyltransferase [Aquabacterium sp. CECT 9606]
MAAHSKPPLFINGRFLGQGVTGIQRYARETLACMDDQLAPGGAYRNFAPVTILAPQGTPDPGLRHIRFQHVGRLSGHAWEQTELAWHARRGLLFTFAFAGPLLHRWQVTTVHDAGVVRVPEAYTAKFRLWYNFMVRSLVKHSPLTVAVSQFSKQEAIACFGAKAERIGVTTEGWQHLDKILADDTILDKHQLRGQPFVLAVSSANPNKNFGSIVKALSLLGSKAPRCVVAGATNSAVFQQTTETSEHMVKLGYVSDGELKALYQNASCFVFPSFYEGFGIPPLEAMASGCPVIASTADAVKETCGDAALYFDPHRPEQLAQRLTDFFKDPALAPAMAQAGRARAAQYSWQRSATLNLDLLQAVLSQRGRPA